MCAPTLLSNISPELPTMKVGQRKDENPNITVMYFGFIAGTPVFPKIAFSVDLLELFYPSARGSTKLASF